MAKSLMVNSNNIIFDAGDQQGRPYGACDFDESDQQGRPYG